MAFRLFSRVALSVNLPEHNLKAGDVATIVDMHAAGARTGYSLEVFNALGDTIAVVVVDETQIEVLREDEVLHARQYEKIAAWPEDALGETTRGNTRWNRPCAIWPPRTIP